MNAKRKQDKGRKKGRKEERKVYRKRRLTYSCAPSEDSKKAKRKQLGKENHVEKSELINI